MALKLRKRAKQKVEECLQDVETFRQELPAGLEGARSRELTDTIFKFDKQWKKMKTQKLLSDSPLLAKHYQQVVESEGLPAKDFWKRWYYWCNETRWIAELQREKEDSVRNKVLHLSGSNSEAAKSVTVVPETKKKTSGVRGFIKNKLFRTTKPEKYSEPTAPQPLATSKPLPQQKIEDGEEADKKESGNELEMSESNQQLSALNQGTSNDQAIEESQESPSFDEGSNKPGFIKPIVPTQSKALEVVEGNSTTAGKKNGDSDHQQAMSLKERKKAWNQATSKDSQADALPSKTLVGNSRVTKTWLQTMETKESSSRSTEDPVVTVSLQERKSLWNKATNTQQPPKDPTKNQDNAISAKTHQTKNTKQIQPSQPTPARRATPGSKSVPSSNTEVDSQTSGDDTVQVSLEQRRDLWNQATSPKPLARKVVAEDIDVVPQGITASRTANADHKLEKRTAHFDKKRIHSQPTPKADELPTATPNSKLSLQARKSLWGEVTSAKSLKTLSSMKEKVASNPPVSKLPANGLATELSSAADLNVGEPSKLSLKERKQAWNLATASKSGDATKETANLNVGMSLKDRKNAWGSVTLSTAERKPSSGTAPSGDGYEMSARIRDRMKDWKNRATERRDMSPRHRKRLIEASLAGVTPPLAQKPINMATPAAISPVPVSRKSSHEPPKTTADTVTRESSSAEVKSSLQPRTTRRLPRKSLQAKKSKVTPLHAKEEAQRRRLEAETYSEPLQRFGFKDSETQREVTEFVYDFRKTYGKPEYDALCKEELQRHSDTVAIFFRRFVPDPVSDRDFWERYLYRTNEDLILRQSRRRESAELTKMGVKRQRKLKYDVRGEIIQELSESSASSEEEEHHEALIEEAPKKMVLKKIEYESKVSKAPESTIGIPRSSSNNILERYTSAIDRKQAKQNELSSQGTQRISNLRKSDDPATDRVATDEMMSAEPTEPLLVPKLESGATDDLKIDNVQAKTPGAASGIVEAEQATNSDRDSVDTENNLARGDDGAAQTASDQNEKEETLEQVLEASTNAAFSGASQYIDQGETKHQKGTTSKILDNVQEAVTDSDHDQPGRRASKAFDDVQEAVASRDLDRPEEGGNGALDTALVSDQSKQDDTIVDNDDEIAMEQVPEILKPSNPDADQLEEGGNGALEAATVSDQANQAETIADNDDEIAMEQVPEIPKPSKEPKEVEEVFINDERSPNDQDPEGSIDSFEDKLRNAAIEKVDETPKRRESFEVSAGLSTKDRPVEVLEGKESISQLKHEQVHDIATGEQSDKTVDEVQEKPIFENFEPQLAKKEEMKGLDIEARNEVFPTALDEVASQPDEFESGLQENARKLTRSQARNLRRKKAKQRAKLQKQQQATEGPQKQIQKEAQSQGAGNPAKRSRRQRKKQNKQSSKNAQQQNTLKLQQGTTDASISKAHVDDEFEALKRAAAASMAFFNSIESSDEEMTVPSQNAVQSSTMNTAPAPEDAGSEVDSDDDIKALQNAALAALSFVKDQRNDISLEVGSSSHRPETGKDASDMKIEEAMPPRDRLDSSLPEHTPDGLEDQHPQKRQKSAVVEAGRGHQEAKAQETIQVENGASEDSDTIDKSSEVNSPVAEVLTGLLSSDSDGPFETYEDSSSTVGAAVQMSDIIVSKDLDADNETHAAPLYTSVESKTNEKQFQDASEERDTADKSAGSIGAKNVSQTGASYEHDESEEQANENIVKQTLSNTVVKTNEQRDHSKNDRELQKSIENPASDTLSPQDSGIAELPEIAERAVPQPDEKPPEEVEDHESEEIAEEAVPEPDDKQPHEVDDDESEEIVEEAVPEVDGKQLEKVGDHESEEIAERDDKQPEEVDDHESEEIAEEAVPEPADKQPEEVDDHESEEIAGVAAAEPDAKEPEEVDGHESEEIAEVTAVAEPDAKRPEEVDDHESEEIAEVAAVAEPDDKEPEEVDDHESEEIAEVAAVAEPDEKQPEEVAEHESEGIAEGAVAEPDDKQLEEVDEDEPEEIAEEAVAEPDTKQPEEVDDHESKEIAEVAVPDADGKQPEEVDDHESEEIAEVAAVAEPDDKEPEEVDDHESEEIAEVAAVAEPDDQQLEEVDDHESEEIAEVAVPDADGKQPEEVDDHESEEIAEVAAVAEPDDKEPEEVDDHESEEIAEVAAVAEPDDQQLEEVDDHESEEIAEEAVTEPDTKQPEEVDDHESKEIAEVAVPDADGKQPEEVDDHESEEIAEEAVAEPDDKQPEEVVDHEEAAASPPNATADDKPLEGASDRKSAVASPPRTLAEGQQKVERNQNKSKDKVLPGRGSDKGGHDGSLAGEDEESSSTAKAFSANQPVQLQRKTETNESSSRIGKKVSKSLSPKARKLKLEVPREKSQGNDIPSNLDRKLAPGTTEKTKKSGKKVSKSLSPKGRKQKVKTLKGDPETKRSRSVERGLKSPKGKKKKQEPASSPMEAPAKTESKPKKKTTGISGVKKTKERVEKVETASPILVSPGASKSPTKKKKVKKIDTALHAIEISAETKSPTKRKKPKKISEGVDKGKSPKSGKIETKKKDRKNKDKDSGLSPKGKKMNLQTPKSPIAQDTTKAIPASPKQVRSPDIFTRGRAKAQMIAQSPGASASNGPSSPRKSPQKRKVSPRKVAPKIPILQNINIDEWNSDTSDNDDDDDDSTVSDKKADDSSSTGSPPVILLKSSDPPPPRNARAGRPITFRRATRTPIRNLSQYTSGSDSSDTG